MRHDRLPNAIRRLGGADCDGFYDQTQHAEDGSFGPTVPRHRTPDDPTIALTAT
jgi:hypothetical protein